jgi:beta-lactamase regulating signal transducer with metallopeptidase domain
LAIQRKLEGKVSKVGKTVTGLSEAMEANVQSSATNYTFFVVNSFFLALWLLFSLTVFANMNVV